MIPIDCYRVVAFADQPLSGNPACVCPLSSWLPDTELQRIAEVNGVSATAFLVSRQGAFDLRWFTPTSEIELCGHGTLASAFVFFTELEPDKRSVRFHTKSGVLDVIDGPTGITLDLPALAAHPEPPPAGLAEALGLEGGWTALAADRRTAFVLARAEAVRALTPDFTALLALPNFGAAIVTAAGSGRDADVDFVSRYFAPHHGVPEDPVTGSAHCLLTPFWSEKLKRASLRARQVSERGGELGCELRGSRVCISGRAMLVERGVFRVPHPAKM